MLTLREVLDVFVLILGWTARGSFYFMGSVVVALIMAAFFAPLAALRWSARERRNEQTGITNSAVPPVARNIDPSNTLQFVVYLPGIGHVSSARMSAMEQTYLATLAARQPNSVIIADVFPFSPTNTALTEEARLGRFWRWLHDNRLHQRRGQQFSELINLRNALQLLVSADQRYGPLYNRATATTIAQRLVEHGYRVDSGTPVTLMRYSGGGQIALGAATYLRPMLGAPLQIISLAGVMHNDPGIDVVDGMYHLYGERDGFPHIGEVVFRNRWKRHVESRWNRAVAVGKLQLINLGPMTHCDAECYFDAHSVLPSGKTHPDHTVDVTSCLVASFVENKAQSLPRRQLCTS